GPRPESIRAGTARAGPFRPLRRARPCAASRADSALSACATGSRVAGVAGLCAAAHRLLQQPSGLAGIAPPGQADAVGIARWQHLVDAEEGFDPLAFGGREIAQVADMAVARIEIGRAHV